MPSKLLLADDSVTIQRVIELTFADEDVQVMAVSNGQQAIERLATEKPDIVLADVGMPERDGYEVAAFIKGDPRFSAIPVLLLTGAFEPVDEARARAVGCDGVLVKPFEPQMVISRVKELLAGGGEHAVPAPHPIGLKSAAPGGDRSGAAAIVEATRPEPRPKPQALEEYFDRLDAAFASVSPGAPRPAPIEVPRESGKPAEESAAARRPAPVAEISRWDPEVNAAAAGPDLFPVQSIPRETAPAPQPPVSIPTRPPAATASSQPPPTAPAIATPPAAAASSSLASASLTEAFAALLSAERGQAVAPVAPAQPVISEETIEEVTRRVLARMGSEEMRRAVLDAAERLVREEIDRIKSGK